MEGGEVNKSSLTGAVTLTVAAFVVSNNQTVRQSDSQTVRHSDSQTVRHQRAIQSDSHTVSQSVRQSDSLKVRQSDSQTVRQ